MLETSTSPGAASAAKRAPCGRRCRQPFRRRARTRRCEDPRAPRGRDPLGRRRSRMHKQSRAPVRRSSQGSRRRRAIEPELPIDVGAVLLLRSSPWIVGRPHRSCEAAPDHERRGPIRDVAAKSALIGTPSTTPNTAVRREPTASITARRSSMRSSRVGAPVTWSDIPVPRLSRRIRRANAASSGAREPSAGSSNEARDAR